MKMHLSRTRRQLGELGGLAAQTEAAERRILTQAEKRHEEVSAAIERARPGIEAAGEKAQDRYLTLVRERAQLQVVAAKAKARLQKS